MHTKKISLSNFICPKKIDISNEQVLFKDKLRVESKNKKKFLENNGKQKNLFLKDKEIQENSIKEEDEYNSDIYNNSISKEENFLDDLNNKDNYKTIQVNNIISREENKNNVEFNNNKTFNLNNNNNNQNFCSTSIEFKNNLNLNTNDENDKTFDKIKNTNTNFLMNNINIFKMVHKDRNNTKLFNQLLLKDNNKEKNIIELNNKNNNKNKYIISNKFSKKYRNNKNKEIDISPVIKHSKAVTQPFNGPYLRKNKVSQINANKNVNKKISSDVLKIIHDGKKEDINSKNISEIKALTKNIFNRYSQIDTNIYDQKIYTTDDKFDKDESINEKKKMRIITSSLYDFKNKDFMLKNNNGRTNQNKNSYIFNLKYYNLHDNKQKNNVKTKSKSNSMINEYTSFDENNIKNINNFNIENNAVSLKEILPKNRIIKKRVIFEEEYIIDSNGNQKFLCVKRIVDDNNNKNANLKNYSTKENHLNKRALTSSDLTISSKRPNEKIKPNLNQINNSRKINNVNYNKQNNEKGKLEAKTIFCSPQMSYENIFSFNNNLAKSYSNISENKIDKIEKTKSIINNVNKLTEKDLTNSRSCIFKFTENNKFHKIDNNNINKNNKSKIIKISNQNINKENEGKKIVFSKYINMNYEKPIIAKKKFRKKYDGDNIITVNNSRNYNINNYININNNDFNNKEKYILNNSNNNNNSKNNIKYVYNTTIFENNKIYLPMNIFSNNSENYKYHEIKSVSKGKTNNQINNANKSHNNHFYFESFNKKRKMYPSISMDNIKKENKNNTNFGDSKYQNKDIFKKNNKNIEFKSVNIYN